MRGLGWPFWLLMVFSLVLLLSPQSFIGALRPLHLAFASAGLAALIYGFDRYTRRQPLLPMTRTTVLTLGLLGLAIVTVPLSYWPGGSFSFLTSLYLKALIIFWLLSNIVDTLPKLQIIAAALSLMAVPLALSAVGSFLSGGFFHEELSHGLHRIVGYDAALTGNPNDLALMLNLILPLTIALFLGTRRNAWRVALLAFICLDVIAIIATFSRGGFIILGVTILVYLWKLFRRRQRGLVFAAMGLLLIAVPLVPGGYVSRLATITNIQADPTGSAQARWADTVAAADYVLHHPLVGAGAGMDILALNQMRGVTWTEVHNVYLQYAVELGIPGLLLFLLLFRECFKAAKRAQRLAGNNQTLCLLAEGLWISLLDFAVAGFFYPDAYEFYFYYIAGLAIAVQSVAAGMVRTEHEPASQTVVTAG
ncbi:MAG: O-antigen ligase family protein [Gammaproteobacteria bacterium]